MRLNPYNPEVYDSGVDYNVCCQMLFKITFFQRKPTHNGFIDIVFPKCVSPDVVYVYNSVRKSYHNACIDVVYPHQDDNFVRKPCHIGCTDMVYLQCVYPCVLQEYPLMIMLCHIGCTHKGFSPVCIFMCVTQVLF